MKLPKQQVILARTRGNKTKFYYGATLKECLSYCVPGDIFCYRIYKAGVERAGKKVSETTYTLEG